jgi:hypothetical protein
VCEGDGVKGVSRVSGIFAMPWPLIQVQDGVVSRKLVPLSDQLPSSTRSLGISTMLSNMNRTAAQEKGIAECEHLEIVQDNAAKLQPTHYRPHTEAEKKLDKRVNRKLDLIVVTLLAVEFIVSSDYMVMMSEHPVDTRSSAA